MSPDNQQSKKVAPTIERAPSPPVRHRCPSSRSRKLSAAAFVAFLAIVATTSTSHAWQCVLPNPTTAVVLCEDGICSEGFGIDHVLTDVGCNMRPVVRELSADGLSVFAEGVRHSYHRDLSGVFEAQVDHYCLNSGWRRKQCFAPTSVRLLSESADPQSLDTYRSEWLETERQAYRSSRSWMWKRSAIFLVLTVLVIGWPWALGALIPAFKRNLGWVLLVAIPVQMLMCLRFLVNLALTIGPIPVLWQWLDTTCAIVIVVAIPIQLGTFIRRKFKTRARPA